MARGVGPRAQLKETDMLLEIKDLRVRAEHKELTGAINRHSNTLTNDAPALSNTSAARITEIPNNSYIVIRPGALVHASFP